MKVIKNGTDRLLSEIKALKKRVNELEAELAEQVAGQKAGNELKSWLDSLLDMLPAFVYLLAPDYTVPFANKFFIDRFGRPEGKPCYELLRDRNIPCDYCPSLSVLESGEPLVWEWTETVDGRAYLVYDYPFHDIDGSPLVLELGIDITDRKAMLDELKKSRTLQDAILDNIPDVAWLKDTEFRYTAVNESLAAAAGLPKARIIGKTDFDIWPGWLAEQYRADDIDVIATGKRKSIEELMVGVDGVERWMHTIKTPISGSDGKTIGLAGIARNISKRKIAEDELKKFKFILDGAGEEFFMLDRNGNIHYVNDAAARSLGYGRDRLKGMRVTDVAKGLTLDGWREEFDQLKAGDVPAFERIHVDSGGRETPKEVKSVYLKISGQEYVCAFARDISERKRSEQERTEFLAMVSHDIRSPMTTIIGMSELVAERGRDTLDEESLEMLGDINRSGRKVTDMLKDFVTVARLEIGKLPINYFPVKPAVIVEECMLDYAQMASEKPVELSSHIEEGLETVELDKDLVERALGNLVTNAINYTPAGGHITVGTGARMEDGVRMLELSVQDDGPGIPPEEHELAFQKYARLKTATGVKGTGLGLPIVKAIAAAHGGRVELVSEEGKGARFAILLPYRKDES